MFTCQYCDSTFKNGHSLSSHKSRYHGPNSNSTIPFINGPAGQKPRKADACDTNKILAARSDDDSDASSEDGAESDTTTEFDEEANQFQPKRKHQSDSSDDEQPTKFSKVEGKKYATNEGKDSRLNSNKKRVHISDSEDEENEKKRHRRDNHRSTYKELVFQERIKHLEKAQEEISAQYWELKDRYHELKKAFENGHEQYSKLQRKNHQLLKDLENENEQKVILTEQLGQVKNGNFEGITAVEKALMNSVTIEQIAKIRGMIEIDRLDLLLEDEEALTTIQRIMTGMLEGVIPISNPQEMAFTSRQRKFMSLLERVTRDQIKDTITDNLHEFYEVFDILDISLKMITKAFNKYGEN